MNRLPAHLSLHEAQGHEAQGHEAQGLTENEVIAQFEIGDLKNFVYLILDWQTRQAGIVDPQSDLSEPMKALSDHGFQLAAILLTHSHHDHVAGVPELIRRYPEIPVYVHADDAHRLDSMAKGLKQLILIKDQDEIKIGNQVITAFHTPGHSAGEISYFLKTDRPYLFTGDTIFIRDCGRTDFATGSDQEMFSSIQRIKTFPLETVFLPGHHYKKECATTLERELKESPPFQCKSVQELKDLP